MNLSRRSGGASLDVVAFVLVLSAAARADDAPKVTHFGYSAYERESIAMVVKKVGGEIDPSHAFYLGYELAKAVTALTLGKNYVQDQALRWGFLTVPEPRHRTSDIEPP